MQGLRIGVQIVEKTAPATVDAIVRAEELGLDAAWLTLGGVRPDSVAIFAAAATRTSRIKLGTSIIPIYPRHPFALAQEAKVVAELAPGRFRLGVGPSHKPQVEGTWGIPFHKPLAHMREYLGLLKAALQQGGPVHFAGEFYTVNADWGQPVDVQVMASGLRWKAFEQIGEMADGGISWVSPLRQVENVALPAMSAGAAKAGRPRPVIVMHVGISLHADVAAVREAALKQFGWYVTLPFYRQMFVDAGFPEAVEGTMTEPMVDAIVIGGDEEAVAARLQRIAAAGVDEVICTVVGAGSNPRSTAEGTLRLLAGLSAST